MIASTIITERSEAPGIFNLNGNTLGPETSERWAIFGKLPCETSD